MNFYRTRVVAEFVRVNSRIFRGWTKCGGMFEYVGGGILNMWKFLLFWGYRHTRCNLIIMATGLFSLYFGNVSFDIIDGTSVLER